MLRFAPCVTCVLNTANLTYSCFVCYQCFGFLVFCADVHDFSVLRSLSHVCTYFSNVFILNRWCCYFEKFLLCEWARETRQYCFAVTVFVFVRWLAHFGSVAHRVGVAKALYSTRDRVLCVL